MALREELKVRILKLVRTAHCSVAAEGELAPNNTSHPVFPHCSMRGPACRIVDIPATVQAPQTDILGHPMGLELHTPVDREDSHSLMRFVKCILDTQSMS